MNRFVRPAFTLVELLVVIAIIGVLAGVLISSFSGGTESANAAKCLNNMRNLAQGAMSYAASGTDTRLPFAGSQAVAAFDSKGVQYLEYNGWISWLSQNDEYRMRTKGDHPRSYISIDSASAYTEDEKKGLFAVTNGSLWRAVNFNQDIYVCPTHRQAVIKKGKKVWWSYVMNAYFGYDYSDGSRATGIWGEKGRSPSDTAVRPERRLMFAELPLYGTGQRYDEGGRPSGASYPTSGDTEVDAVLQYKAYEFHKNWSGKVESIAFNHKSAKRFCAHVVFADGHTEKLLKPKSKSLSDEQLTALLCAGKDISFDGSDYTWVNASDTTE